MNKIAVAKCFESFVAHPCHNFHIDDGVRRIGNLHPELRNRRTNRSHTKRNDVERSTRHRAVTKAVDLKMVMRFRNIHLRKKYIGHIRIKVLHGMYDDFVDARFYKFP